MTNSPANKRKFDEELFEEFIRFYKKKKPGPDSIERSGSPDSMTSSTAWNVEYLEESLEEPPEDGEIKEEDKDESKEIIGQSAKTETITIEDDIEEELLTILGKDKENTPERSPKVHEQVAKIWNNILSGGMSKEQANNILKKYPPIENMTLNIPKLNPEAELALNETGKKRDKGISNNQKQIASAITALGGLLSDIISTKEIQPKIIIEKIGDAGRMLCNLFHSKTMMRRYLVLNVVNRDLRQSLENKEPQEFLFGNNLSESIKTARTVARASQDLKLKATPSSSKHLNYRNPPPQPNSSRQHQRQGQRQVGRGPIQRRPFYQPQRTNIDIPNNRQRTMPRGHPQKRSYRQ